MARSLKTSLPCSIALAICLAGCGGGGGGGGLVATPPPAPTPPGSPALVTAATTSQELATKGASYTSPIATYGELVVSTPSLADSAQLDVRYNAASQSYEIQLPADSQWQPIELAADYGDGTYLYRTGSPDHVGVVDHRSNLQYSALLWWFTDELSGYSAVGIATAPGGVPVTGSASYTGSIIGSTSETSFDPWEGVWYPNQLRGSINLSFNFGSGSLAGSINPDGLPSLSFINTVYSTGSTTFSGEFATAVPGVNSFSGLFTGPNANELVGNFAFPYLSPTGGSQEQAAGAFAGRRP